MRLAYSNQLRLDSVPIVKVELNLNCRDSVVPVLKALQQIYANKSLTDRILKLIGNDVSQGIRADKGRKGMQYWHICVLMAVRLGCNYTCDQLADLAENHRKLSAIMGLGDCDPTTFHHKTLRNTFCLVRPETIEQINLAIVQYGHQLEPQASQATESPNQPNRDEKRSSLQRPTEAIISGIAAKIGPDHRTCSRPMPGH